MIYYLYTHGIRTWQQSGIRLDNIESTMDFTYEQESDNTLPFLDILRINNNKLEFKAHHKCTNENIFLFTS